VIEQDRGLKLINPALLTLFPFLWIGQREKPLYGRLPQEGS
jgi:hypothetical protein